MPDQRRPVAPASTTIHYTTIPGAVGGGGSRFCSIAPIPHPRRRASRRRRHPARPQRPAGPVLRRQFRSRIPKSLKTGCLSVTPRPLRPQTPVPYPDTRVKQPGRRQSFLARYTGRPPPPRPARDGQPGGNRLAFVSTQPDNPVHRPTSTQPRHAIEGLRGRRRPAASTGLPTASHPHRGKVRAGRPARKRPNPCRNFTMQLVLLRRYTHRMARVVLCQPAGVTTVPCRMTQPA